MPHSQTVDEATAPRGRDTEHKQPQHKVKQPALSSSAKLLMN